MIRIVPFAVFVLVLAATRASADDHFVGKWANVDDKTGGMTRIEIAKKDKGWTIQAWGRAGDRENDLGKVTLSLLGDPVPASEMKYGFASWDHGFVVMHLTLRLEKDRLIVEDFNIFKDDPARNYRSRDEFKKTRAADQREAMAAIRKLGGKVEVDADSAGKPVIKVNLNGTKVTDADLKHLEALAELQTLDLGGTAIGDAGLEHLKDLTKLNRLVLDNTKVTDAGVKQLRRLTDLKHLSLYLCVKVTDAGVRHLKGLTKLQYLDLGEVQLTDAGLKHLHGLTQLKNLYLGDAADAKVTEAGIQELQKALPKVEIVK